MVQHLSARRRPGCGGVSEIQLARQRDPLSLQISDIAFHHYYTGRYDEAVKQLKFVLENRNFPPAHLWLGRTFQELGKFDDAQFRQVEETLREWPVSIAARGFVSAAAGRTDEAREILVELERLASRKFVTSYGIALVYVGLDQADAALASLNRAFDERSHWRVWLRLDPRWNKLRGDPRFIELGSRMCGSHNRAHLCGTWLDQNWTVVRAFAMQSAQGRCRLKANDRFWRRKADIRSGADVA